MTRALAWILVGVAGSVACRDPRLFSGDDPLTSTLRMLPLVLGLFAAAFELLPEAVRKKGSLFGPRLVLGCGWVVLALAREQLGLRYGATVGSAILAAGLFTLLFWQAAEGLRSLSASAEGGTRRLLAFFLTVLAVYLGVLPWSTDRRPPNGDEPYYLLLTHSLAYDFDTDLANNYEQGDSLRFMHRRIEPQLGDPVGSSGEKYSRHNAALPVVLAPAYRILGALGAFGLMAVLTAMLAAWILRLADLYFPERPRAGLLAASIAAFSPPLLLYSHQVWVEMPAALLTAIALDGVLGPKRRPFAWRRLGQITLPILLLPLVKMRFLALSVSLLGLAILRTPPRLRTRLLRAGTALLALTALTLLFNRILFGQELKHHSWASLASYFVPPSDYATGILGLFFDHAFGLLLASPIWILLIPGVFRSLADRSRLLVDAVIVCTPYLLLLGPRSYWYGGWSPPFRYGIAFIPLLSILMVPALARRRETGMRLLIGFLLAATIVLTILWLVLPGWTYNFADGRSHLVDSLSVAFGADVARLVPSWIRPRSANLVWILTLVALIPTAAWILRAKARPATSTWGVTALLLVIASVPLLATRLPVEVVEFEDPSVGKTGGEAWPDRWTPNRQSFRGSWRLRQGDEVQVKIVPRGAQLGLELDARKLGHPRTSATLELLSGNRQLLQLELPPSDAWSTVKLDPLTWPRDETTLTLRLVGPPGADLLLDRVQLGWRK